jgi:hypothetical protein
MRRGILIACALAVCVVLAPAGVAGAHPSARQARISIDRVTVVRVSDGMAVRLVKRGRISSYRAQYTIRGGSGTGRVVMRIRNDKWLFTISSKAQYVHPGVWRFAARAAIPARFPAGAYTMTTTVTLQQGSKTAAAATVRRPLRIH